VNTEGSGGTPIGPEDVLSARLLEHSRDVKRVKLSGASDEELAILSHELGLALSVEEMECVRGHFEGRGRDPTDIEIQAIGQSWSEHCCYKSSKPYLKKYITGITTDDCLIQITEDAGVVNFDDEHAYVTGLESHNHPSALDPYGGAATGVGGILRDVICMGGQPIFLTDPLFFAPLDTSFETLPRGTKHPLYLLKGVVNGIADYGNRMGIPTISGCVQLHEDYLINPLVNVGCVGLVRKDHIIHSRVSDPNAVFVLAGGRTGRDGIHGVTFASQDLTTDSEEGSRGAVQLGNPIIKEPLLHACLEANEAGLLDGMKDLGGGGLSCVIGEMADAGGYGAEVYMERIPLKEEGLSPWEIWVSESQERMMVSVLPENLDRVLEIFDLWDVEAVVVGKVMEERRLRVLYDGIDIFSMEVSFLTDGPTCVLERGAPRPKTREVEDIFTLPPALTGPGMRSSLLDILGSQNVASRESIIRRYDHEVRANTLLKPMQGVFLSETHGDASIVKPVPGSWKGLSVTTTAAPDLLALDPYRGALALIDETVRNLVAVNSRPHTLADNLNFGNPTRPEVLWELDSTLRAFRDMCEPLSLPFVSGNVSLYNEGVGKAIPPSPSILACGIIDDARTSITSDLKKEGNSLFLVGVTNAEFGGSELFARHGLKGKGVTPASNPTILSSLVEGILAGMATGAVRACHDISHGGLATTIVEMGIGGSMGAGVDLSRVEVFPLMDIGAGEDSDIHPGTIERAGRYTSEAHRATTVLFSESSSRWVVEVEKGREDEFRTELGDIIVVPIGTVGGGSFFFFDEGAVLFELPLEEANMAWRSGLTRYIDGWDERPEPGCLTPDTMEGSS